MRSSTCTPHDDRPQLGYADVIVEKLLESPSLRQQAAGNDKAQFASTPDLSPDVRDAIIDAFDAPTTMSTILLDSNEKRERFVHDLLHDANPWERLRACEAAPLAAER
jgi:type I restriction enzyme R subunit